MVEEMIVIAIIWSEFKEKFPGLHKIYLFKLLEAFGPISPEAADLFRLIYFNCTQQEVEKAYWKIVSPP